MARKKKEYKIEIIEDDVEEIYYYYNKEEFEGKTFYIYLSEKCQEILEEDYFYRKYVETVSIIYDKICGNEKIFRVYSYIKNKKIMFTITIDGFLIDNNYTLDSEILNTCFGTCIRNSLEYEYVDFDKYF